MEPGTLTHSAVTYAFASAIPLVALSLWFEYFKQYTFSESDGDREEKNSKDELFEQDRLRLRAAHFFTLFAQAMIYIASAPLRAMAWLPCACIFAALLVFQSRLTQNAEMEMRKLYGFQQPSPTTERNQIAGRILLWNVFSMLAYIATVQIAAICSAIITHSLGFPREAVVAMTLVGGLVGIGIGLGMTFALAPLQARKTLPIQPIRDPELLALFNRLKMKVLGAEHPLEASIVETQDTQWANAWVAGFTHGTGRFRPHLFLTSSLLKHFQIREIESILMHELGHVKMNHLKKRFQRSVFYLTISTLFLSSATLLSLVFLPGPVVSVPLMALTLACMVIPFQKIRKTVETQENEADSFVVEQLHTDASTYIAVLKKLSQIHPSPIGNQALFDRMKALEAQFAPPASIHSIVTASSDEDDSSKAA